MFMRYYGGGVGHLDARGVGGETDPMEEVGDEGVQPDSADGSDDTDDDNTGGETDSGESSDEDINV